VTLVLYYGVAAISHTAASYAGPSTSVAQYSKYSSSFRLCSQIKKKMQELDGLVHALYETCNAYANKDYDTPFSRHARRIHIDQYWKRAKETGHYDRVLSVLSEIATNELECIRIRAYVLARTEDEEDLQTPRYNAWLPLNSLVFDEYTSDIIQLCKRIHLKLTKEIKQQRRRKRRRIVEDDEEGEEEEVEMDLT